MDAACVRRNVARDKGQGVPRSVFFKVFEFEISTIFQTSKGPLNV